MSNTRYRRGSKYAADMAAYSRAMAEDNSQQMARLKHNLARALREAVSIDPEFQDEIPSTKGTL